MVENWGDNICDNCGSDRGAPDLSSVSVDNCGTCKRRTCGQCSTMMEFCGRNMCFDCLKGKHQYGSQFESRCPVCHTGLREASLHQAAKSGDVESIQQICEEEGVDVNARERQCFVQAGWAPLLHKGRTPMYYAVLGGHIDAVGKLLSLGASDNSIASEYPDSHIDIIQLAEEKEHPVIKNMLIESFARRKLTGEDISFVVRRGMKDRVVELLDQVPVNCIDTEDFFGFTPLQEAIFADDLDMVRLLLEKSSKLDIGSENAVRALKFAVGNNCNDIVVELLSRGFSFEGAGSPKWSDLLYSAVMSDNKDLASLIIDKGADIEAIHENPYSQTVLHYAIADSKVEMAGFLIDKGADLNTRNDEGMSPLHAACRSRLGELVYKLIEAGADVNSEDDGGRTPLHHVALRSPSDVKIKYNINDESFEHTETELNDTFTESSPMVYTTMLHILLSGILDRTDVIVTSLLHKGAGLQQNDKSKLTPLKTALISDSVISAYSLAKAGAKLEPSSLEHVGKLKDLGLADNMIESLLELKSSYEDNPEDTEGSRSPREKTDMVKHAIQHELPLPWFAKEFANDPTPSNILIDEKNNVRLTDFGIVKEVTKEGSSFFMAGTRGWMAPEVYFDPQYYETPVDIYSAGLVFYALLTKKSDSEMQVLWKNLISKNASPESIKDVPEKYAPIIHRSLQFDENERYQNAGEMLEELEKITSPAKSRAKDKPKSPPRKAVKAMVDKKAKQGAKPPRPGQVNGKTCAKCGSVMSRTAKFCGGCGDLVNSNPAKPKSKGDDPGNFWGHFGIFLIVWGVMALIDTFTGSGGWPHMMDFTTVMILWPYMFLLPHLFIVQLKHDYRLGSQRNVWFCFILFIVIASGVFGYCASPSASTPIAVTNSQTQHDPSATQVAVSKVSTSPGQKNPGPAVEQSAKSVTGVPAKATAAPAEPKESSAKPTGSVSVAVPTSTPTQVAPTPTAVPEPTPTNTPVPGPSPTPVPTAFPAFDQVVRVLGSGPAEDSGIQNPRAAISISTGTVFVADVLNEDAETVKYVVKMFDANGNHRRNIDLPEDMNFSHATFMTVDSEDRVHISSGGRYLTLSADGKPFSYRKTRQHGKDVNGIEFEEISNKIQYKSGNRSYCDTGSTNLPPRLWTITELEDGNYIQIYGNTTSSILVACVFNASNTGAIRKFNYNFWDKADDKIAAKQLEQYDGYAKGMKFDAQYIVVRGITSDKNNTFIHVQNYGWPYDLLLKLSTIKINNNEGQRPVIMGIVPNSDQISSMQTGAKGRLHITGGVNKDLVRVLDQTGKDALVLGGKDHMSRLRHPRKIDSDPVTGQVVVDTGTVLNVYDSELNPVLHSVKGAKSRTLAGITPDGNVMLTTYRFDDGKFVIQLKTPGSLNKPPAPREWGESGAKPGQFNGDPRVWVGSLNRIIYAADNTRLQLFDSNGKFSGIWQPELGKDSRSGQPLTGPDHNVCHLAEHPNGFVYYGYRKDVYNLHALDGLGIGHGSVKIPAEIDGTENCQGSLEVDKNGNFYYGLGNSIHVFDQKGNKLRGTTLQASDNIVDLEFSRDGNLLVLTGGKWGKIIEITQSGVSNK